MCGITGFIDFDFNSNERSLVEMVKQLHHRGPDSNGTEVIDLNSARIGLGHARLSIIDLSSLGHQPMAFEQLYTVFNGEIYNYREIRGELQKKGRSFRTASDTEVILQAYQEWGSDCVSKFIGMFAFVILDTQRSTIEFFRDRAGVKPLYFYKDKNLILFASELKSFHVHTSFSKSINRDVLHDYLNLGVVPGSKSIFAGVEKLQPGTSLHLDLNTGKSTQHEYWNPAKFLQSESAQINYQDAVESLHSLLISACKYRMVSDVPIGVFLSGGYDSTAVASILQRRSSEQIKTFTIGFESGNNEAPFAKQIARHLGTDHHEYTCTTKEAQEIIPDLPFYFDEPFADSSAIPTVLVSKFAKEKVKVALSADGGDELFAGYSRYQNLSGYFEKLEKLGLSGQLLLQLLKRITGPFLSFKYKHQIEGAIQCLNRSDHREAYKSLYDVMHRIPRDYHKLIIGSNGYIPFETNYSNIVTEDLRNYPLLHDFKNYLPDDILTKVDRATMSASLEGREPLLDHRLFEFAAQLPYEYKQDGPNGKRILKDVVHQYVPKEMMDRPKTGFSIPLTRWFKTDLKEMLFDTLSIDNVSKSGVIEPRLVQEILLDFEKGKLHYKPLIWKLLMLQLWCDKSM